MPQINFYKFICVAIFDISDVPFNQFNYTHLTLEQRTHALLMEIFHIFMNKSEHIVLGSSGSFR